MPDIYGRMEWGRWVQMLIDLSVATGYPLPTDSGFSLMPWQAGVARPPAGLKVASTVLSGL
jgi:hypothetical protein